VVRLAPSHRVWSHFRGLFSESKYLWKEVEFSLFLRRIKLHRSETSWTAKVRGAVICGIEKETTSNLAKATALPKRYGIGTNPQYS
jgi:hypothetical protein